jgi:acyl-CoA synthetase (AMP-forming)/AMP-acid ligase II
VTPTANWNFAGLLVERLGANSRVVDAAARVSLSATELRGKITQFGSALRSEGLKPGDRVLIGSRLSVSSVVAYLGTMYAGLVAVPADERTLAASANSLIRATAAKAVWSEISLSSIDCDVVRLQGDVENAGSSLPSPTICERTDLAALMPTSGSTGIPRFVMVSHENLIANTEAIIHSQKLGADEVAMVVLPLSYCFGASLLHSHLYTGGSVVLDRRFMFPDSVLQSMAEFNCTTFAGVPTVYNTLLRRSNLRNTTLPSLKRFLQAGGGLASEKIDEMRTAFPATEFYVMYGQTEATARIACLDSESWKTKHGSVGRPLDNLTVSIVDERGDAVQPGQVGELLVKGPSVCSGYWNDPEETSQAFSNGWLRTGDLARQDADGYLWIEGRKSAFLKIRGTRVSFAEIEGRVAAMPGVFECGACAQSHQESGEALLLMVVPEPEARIDTENIRRSLPAHWTVDSIRVVSELPKTATGKLARSSLLDWARNGYAAIG